MLKSRSVLLCRLANARNIARNNTRNYALYSTVTSTTRSVESTSSSAPAESSLARAQQILQLTKVPEDMKVNFMQTQFLETLGKKPSDADIDLAFEVFTKVLSLGRADRFSCARLSLLCLNAGIHERALEPWTRLLESLAQHHNGTANLERIWNRPDFEPAAMAALACYFVLAGPTADPVTARKLVPRSSLPSNFKCLRSVGGFASPETEELALKGLANLQKHYSDNFTSEVYIDALKKSSFAEVRSRWAQVKLVNNPSEIPEKCCAAFIRRFAETKQVEMSFQVWQMLVQNLDPANVTTDSWSALLKAAALAPANSLAIFTNLWDKMIANGFKPDAQCYAERWVCFTNKQNKRQEAAYEEFRTLQQNFGSDQANQLLSMPGVNVIITSLARQRKFDDVDEILKWCREHNMEPTNYTFNGILSYATYKPELMTKYFVAMTDAGCKPDIVTYSLAVDRNLKMGQSVAELLEEMKKSNITPNQEFHTNLAFRIGQQTKDVKMAREIMDIWRKERTKISMVSLGAFIDLELKYGDVDVAVEYSELASKFGYAQSVPMLNQLIRGSLTRRRYDVALNTFAKLTSGHYARLMPNTYTFMHIVDKWSLAELQDNNELRHVIKKTITGLVDKPDLIDYSLATRLSEIRRITGVELISDQLNEIVNVKMLDLYDQKLAKRRK